MNKPLKHGLPEFRLPESDEHTAIVGRNGSGKTQGGMWILSQRDLANSINVMIDYKGDELLNSIRRARELSTKELPKENGLYVIHSSPFEDEQNRMRAWLYRVWNAGNIGLFVDEGYMIPNEKGGPFQALLTQGRSLRTPIITLSQRPIGVNRFVFSEANHIIYFDLDDDRDKDVIKGFTPTGFVDWIPQGLGVADPYTGEMLLPKYFGKWYNRRDKSRFVLRPVPEASEIIDAIDGQLKPLQRWL